MDQTRFDEWTKRFSKSLNRRQLLRGMMGGAGAITLIEVADQGTGAQSNCDPTLEAVTCPPTAFNAGLIKIPDEGCCAVGNDCCTNYCHHGRCIRGDGPECVEEGLQCVHFLNCCDELVCIADICQPPGTCVGVGEDCADAACCAGLECFEGQCYLQACEPVGELCEVDASCCDGLLCVGGSCDYSDDCAWLGARCHVSSDCCADLLCIDEACGYELPNTGRAVIRAATSGGLDTTAIIGGAVALAAAKVLRSKPAVAPPIHLAPVPRVTGVKTEVEHPNTVRYETANPAADLKSVRFTIDRYDVPPAAAFKQRAADLMDPAVSRRVVGYDFGDQALLFCSSKATPAPDAWLLVCDGCFFEQWYAVGDIYVSTRLFSLANAHYALPLGQSVTERLLQLSELPKGYAETCNTFRNPPILCQTYELEGIVRSESG